MAGRLLALNPGANQYTGPACGAKKCFIAAAAAGNITTTVNKGRHAGPISSLLLLDVYVIIGLLVIKKYVEVINLLVRSVIEDSLEGESLSEAVEADLVAVEHNQVDDICAKNQVSRKVFTSVRPDLAKFCDFGNFSKSFCI